jgi:hypothetical protein
MDFKPALMFVCTVFLTDINDILKTSALIINLGYVSYQFYKYHKNNDKQ